MGIGPFRLRDAVEALSFVVVVVVAVAMFMRAPDDHHLSLFLAAGVFFHLLAVVRLLRNANHGAAVCAILAAAAGATGVLGYLLAYNGLYVPPAWLGFRLIEFVHVHMGVALSLLIAAASVAVAATRRRHGFGAEALAAAGLVVALLVPLLYAGQYFHVLPLDAGALTHPLLHAETALLLGAATLLLLAAFALRGEGFDTRHRFLPAFAFVVLLVASFHLWLVLVSEEQESIRRQTMATAERVKSGMEQHMEVRMQSLYRLADRMQRNGLSDRAAWAHEVSEYLRDFESISAIGWITPDERVRWAVNRDDPNYREGERYAVDEARQEVLARARATGRHAHTIPLPLRSGGHGQLIALPLERDSEFIGWLVVGLRFSALFAQQVGNIAPDFAMVVTSSGQTVFTRVQDSTTHPLAHAVAYDTVFADLAWRITIWPENAFFERNFLWLPGFLLMLGVIAAMLFAFSLYQLEVQRRRAASLRESEERYRLVVEQTGAVVYEYHVPSGRIAWRGAIRELMGATPDEIAAFDIVAWEQRLHPDDAAETMRTLTEAQHAVSRFLCEYRFRRMDDRYVRVEDSGVFLPGSNGQAERMLGKMADVTQRHEFEQQLRYLAHFDQQTGLRNRTWFMEEAVRRAEFSLNDAPSLWFVFLDVDRFRAVNETLGHVVGDLLLEAVARRIEAVVGGRGELARLGGDEFALCVFGPDVDRVVMTSICEQFIAEFSKPFAIAGHSLFVTLSIGIATFPTDGTDIQAVIRAAETAMFRAKHRGRNTYAFYETAMSAGARENLEIANALRPALDRHEFHLVFQPRYSLHSGRITGMEALLRWHSAELGDVSPVQFIPVAEETGLIGPIGLYVISAAAEAARRLGPELMVGRRIAINVSARQLVHADFMRELVQRVAAAGAVPHWFEIELTESVVMEDPLRARELFLRLHDAGFTISIDDFGTGYSSLSYLKNFPVDHLKIDRSFVMGLPDNSDDAAIVRTIVGMGQGLGLKLIAEGIETEAQSVFLRDIGCQEAQGFLFARPLSLAQLAALLD